MSTGLIKPGMKLLQACEEVSRKAEEIRAASSSRVGVWTETGSRSVLVGVSLRGIGRFVITIDKAEYSGLRLAEMVAAL